MYLTFSFIFFRTYDMSSSGPQDSYKDRSIDISPCDPQHSGKGCMPDEKAILRDRKMVFCRQRN